MTINSNEQKPNWFNRPISEWVKTIDIEKIFFALVIILAIFSRFYILGARVMSHDEVNHVRPSWELFEGQGYRHDPVTHGPMQFHLVALSYTLFGDTDFTSRLPSALFSIATVMVVWKFRRYLGKTGALIAAFLMTISPYMLFYGRYTRNESFVGLFGVLTIYLILRYLEKPEAKYILGLAAIFSLQFATKETSYIYTAQALLFLFFLFLKQLFSSVWKEDRYRVTVLVGLLAAIIFFAGAAWMSTKISEQTAAITAATETLSADALTPISSAPEVPSSFKVALGFLALFGLFGVAVAGYSVIKGKGLDEVRKLRSFDLLMLVGTLILPQLVAFPVKLIGWDPLDYSETGMIRTGIVLGVIFLVSVGLGLWWNRQVWWKAAGIFYAIYVFLYTTIFTNGQGFFTGIIGSLGYWLSQQTVNRGSQPFYYYAGIQIPLYEYLPAIGAIIAFVFALVVLSRRAKALEDPFLLKEDSPESTSTPEISEQLPVWLLLYWSFTALLAYTVAGEKMPWLTVHITWPMILVAGWAFARIIRKVEWKEVFTSKGTALWLVSILGIIALGKMIAALNKTPLPFTGNSIEELSATSAFLFALAVLVISAIVIVYLLGKLPNFPVGKVISVTILALLAVLTARIAYMASFINYDTAKEYLVYAHAARGPKDVLKQVEEISQRMTGGKTLRVGYDNSSLYPYWWYLRDYTNLDYFAETPSKTIREDAIVIVGNPNYTKVDPILSKGFYSFEYERLWWPNQDYFNLDWKRFTNAFLDPKIRAGIFQIWLNRDYKSYAEATGSTALTPETWEPAERLKMYIQKDIAAQMWNYGTAPQPVESEIDPYEQARISLTPDVSVGEQGSGDGQFMAPRGVASDLHGGFYVADSQNHRIQHFDASGQFLNAWGKFADSSKGDAPGGTFNEPWGVAVGPDGSVYVADTWNHRIQKFNANGEFITMWGYFGQAEKLDGFWGPRGVAVDSKGRVFVTDTGNKRVVVFGSDGEGIVSFGGLGLEPGQFDEPVGITVDRNDKVYVADTWNQRIQVFTENLDGTGFTYEREWEVSAWSGQSLDNKPFLAISPDGSVFITDPEGYRVIEFDESGQFMKTWGEYSSDTDGFALASGISADGLGVWVSDSVNNRIMHFTLP